MPELSGSGGGALPEREKGVSEPLPALRARHVRNRSGGEVGGGKGAASQGRLPRQGRSLAQRGVFLPKHARGSVIEAKKRTVTLFCSTLVRYYNCV